MVQSGSEAGQGCRAGSGGRIGLQSGVCAGAGLSGGDAGAEGRQL